MGKAPIRYSHFIAALVPLALTPALVLGLAEGWLNLGGGEKDILLVLPYLVLTLVFFVSALVLIIKRWNFRRWIARSAAVCASVLLGLWVAAWATSWLGVA